MSDDWSEQQHADELAIQREIEETLDRARTRPLTDDELRLLAWASGVAEHYNQEAR